jgi:glycerophosphoryl diester phosphodiesterase
VHHQVKEEAHVIPLVYAHRGASGLYPENTMEAFRAALRLQADGIELDVQLSRDGEIVVIHDHRLERTTNGKGLVQQYTLRELRKLRASKKPDPRFPRVRIPTLREVFRTLEPTPLRFIIEFKNFLVPQPHLEELVLETIREYGLTERTVISSFNFDSLKRVKELDPLQRTALLYFGTLTEPWEVAALYGADELHVPEEELTHALVQETKERGFPVIGWTIDHPKQIRQAGKMGVDGIITNYPLRARKSLSKQ